MTITYTWNVTGIKTTTVNNTPNIVVQTYWKKVGTDENGNEGAFHGATPFSTNSSDGSPFIPFEQLTEDYILTKIKSIVAGNFEDHVNRQIQKQIDEKLNIVAEVPMPWVQVANTDPSSNTFI